MVQSRGSEPLVDALCREVGRFEEKVANLEVRCSQILGCISALSEKLKQSRSFFSQHGAEGGALMEGIPPARIAELCGIKDHVEERRSADPGDSCRDLIVHEPDERTIFIDAGLSQSGFRGAPPLELVRAGIARLEGVSQPLRILYVPAQPDPAVCREAEGKRVVVASPSDLVAIFGTVALRWLTFSCGQKARAVVDQGQDLVDVMSAFISDFTDTEKELCELVNDCALSSRSRERDGAALRA